MSDSGELSDDEIGLAIRSLNEPPRTAVEAAKVMLSWADPDVELELLRLVEPDRSQQRSADDFATTTVRFEGTDGDLRLTIDHDRRLLTGSIGRRTIVAAERTDGTRFDASTDDRGGFDIAVDEPGMYRLVVGDPPIRTTPAFMV